MRIIRAVFLLMGFIGLLPGIAAGESLERSGLWGSLDMGAGYVQRDLADDETNFFMGFTGGYAITPQVLLGLELSGWTLQTSSLERSDKGEGIMQAFLVSRLYWREDSGGFVKLGGGYVNHWNNRLGEDRSQKGWGVVAGAGYDFHVYDDSSNISWAVTPILSYHFGKSGDLDHSVINLSLGITLW